MVEIYEFSDILKVKDKSVKEYLEYAFARFEEGYVYPQLGYYIVIQEYEELLQPLKLEHYAYKLPAITDERFFTAYLEVMEIKEEVVDLLLLCNNEYGLNLVMKKEILPQGVLKRLSAYQV